MKKSILTLAVTAITAGSMMTGCSSSEEKVTKVTVDTKSDEQLKEEYTNEYNQFKLESDNRIAENEKEIAALKEENKKLKKADREKAIADLEERNEAMKAKMREYKDDGKDKWQSFKREFSHDMDELGQSLKDFTKNNTK